VRELVLGTKWIAALVAFAAGIIAVVAVFQHNTRSWFLHHAGLGWALGLALVSVAVYLFAALRVRSKELIALRVEATEADHLLLNERLDGWRLNDGVMRWLSGDFYATRIPTDLYDLVRHRCEHWSQDRRKFVSAQLGIAFDELHESAFRFCQIIDERHWYGDLQPSSPAYQRYLLLAGEPGTDDYQAAIDLVAAAHDRFLEALYQIYAAAHRQRVFLDLVDRPVSSD